MTQPDIYQPWTIHLWQAIAQRYADEPTVAGYDLLDEPLRSESNPAKGGPVVRAFLREGHGCHLLGRYQPHHLCLWHRMVRLAGRDEGNAAHVGRQYGLGLP